MLALRRVALLVTVTLTIAAVTSLSTGFRPAAARAGEGGLSLVQVTSHKSFEATKTALLNGIKAAGFVVLGDFNYQMMQKMVGRDIAPAEGFNYFRPDLGTPIFANDPRAAVNIPLKIAVITDGGKVMVLYYRATSLFAQYRGLGDLAQKLDGLTEQIVKQATQ
jgi:uncharacterized protein (DUF302 family)